MKKQRIDRFISNQLGIPRNMAKTQIHRGKVTVNGEILRNPAENIDIENDKITYKGESVSYEEFVYILMNKPAGCLSAAEDKSQKTVVDLVPENIKRKGLFPVGRLDKDTTGLLILTDDGDFAHRCISPNKNVEKEYTATLDGELTGDMIKKFKEGVVLADGTGLKPAKLEIISKNVASITVTEGKYHQIKRMFGTVGLGVDKLKRIRIGSLVLPGNLKEGECLKLTVSEAELVFNTTI